MDAWLAFPMKRNSNPVVLILKLSYLNFYAFGLAIKLILFMVQAEFEIGQENLLPRFEVDV